MKNKILLFSLLLSQSICSHIFAQGIDLSGEVSDTVIVTSSRYEKTINNLPYSAAILGPEKISKSTSQSVPEMLRTEPGLSLIRDGVWGTEVNIRGMSRSNVVTLIDGNRVETSTDVSARLSMIDLNDIERVEVIKGAASTLYGTGAMGGIVNIISKNVNYSNNLFLRGGLSSGYNSVNNGFLSGINLSAGEKSWTARLTGSFRKAGNTKTPSGTLNNSQYKDNSFSGMLNFIPFKNQEVKLNYQQFNAYDVGIPGGYPVFPNAATVSYPETNRKLFSAEYDINNISNSLRKISAKYFNQSMLRDVENIPNQVKLVPGTNGQPTKRVSVLEIDPSAKHKTNGFQMQADFTLGDRHYLITGIDYWERSYNGSRTNSQKIEVLSASGTVAKTSYKLTVDKPLPDASYRSTGVFVHDEINLIEKKLNLTAGGRFDLINLKNEETKNPVSETIDGVTNYSPSSQVIMWKADKAQNTSYSFNAGLLYALTESSSISFNAARSFRSPSLEERYQYIDQGSYLRIGDPQLKPEKGYFFDLGLRVSRNEFKVRASAFYNYLNDLVTEIPGTYEGRNAYIKTNIGEASLYGFELESDYNVMSSLMTYGTVSYVRGKNLKDKNDLPQIPPVNGTVGIKVNILDKIETDLSAVYFTAQNKVAPGELTTPGYVVLNLDLSSVTVNAGIVNLMLSGGVENILNKEYRNHLSTNRGFIVSEPGRNFYLRTNISW